MKCALVPRLRWEREALRAAVDNMLVNFRGLSVRLSPRNRRYKHQDCQPTKLCCRKVCSPDGKPLRIRPPEFQPQTGPGQIRLQGAADGANSPIETDLLNSDVIVEVFEMPGGGGGATEMLMQRWRGVSRKRTTERLAKRPSSQET